MSRLATWFRTAWARVRRRAKHAAIFLCGFALLLALAYALFMWHSNRRVQREMEAIRALGEPTNWDELQRIGPDGKVGAPLPDSQEASRLFTEAVTDAEVFSKTLAAGLLVVPLANLGADDLQTLERDTACFDGAWESLVKVSRLHGVATLPGDGVKVAQESADNASRVRSAFRLIQAKAYLAAGRGQGDAAADVCLVGLRCCGAFPGYNEFTGLVNDANVATMCGTIERTLSVAPCSAERLDQVRRALDELVDDTPMVRRLCGERICVAYGYETNWCNMPRILLRPNHAAHLELAREEVAAARLPLPQSLDRAEQIVRVWHKPLGPRHIFSVFARMNVEVLPTYFTEAARQQARVRLLLVGLAIRRAKLDGLAPPESLEALVPKYLAKVPVDPFSGEAIRYFRDGDDCVIYSIGVDRVDNHGSEKTVPTPGSSAPEDIVLRLRP